MGTIRSVSIEPSGGDGKAALWLTIEFVDEDEHFEDHLRLPPESGKLADFLDDLHDAGIVVDAPHDLVGTRLLWEFDHGYSTEEWQAKVRIPQ